MVDLDSLDRFTLLASHFGCGRLGLDEAAEQLVAYDLELEVGRRRIVRSTHDLSEALDAAKRALARATQDVGTDFFARIGPFSPYWNAECAERSDLDDREAHVWMDAWHAADAAREERNRVAKITRLNADLNDPRLARILGDATQPRANG